MQQNLDTGSAGTLGLLVNSNAHFEAVLNLAEAAAAVNKTVRVHILSNGLELLMDDCFERLERVAAISVCPIGRLEGGPCEALRRVAPRQLADVLVGCDRYLVL